MVEESNVLDALQTVEDPELDISIVELGLVYGVRFEQRDEGTHAEIDLTLTSPGCPAAPDHGCCTPCSIIDRRIVIGAHQSRMVSAMGPSCSCI